MTPLTCVEEVWERPGYWHSHACGRRAKYLARGRGIEDCGLQPFCGTHIKWYQRWRPDTVRLIEP